MGNPNDEVCSELRRCCAPVQLLNQEVQGMNTKLEEISVTMKAIAEKQGSPEISKAWLIFFGVLTTSGVSVINALIANYDKIYKAIWG